jgi:hypothetical protein
MSYIDDLVKLRYLAPMRGAANSTMSNINTFRSRDVIKEFMDKIQTNPDGTTRPGGASGLDMSNPESIQKLVGMESGTLSKLFGISGGKMDTPEAKGIQDISDRILKGMNIGSDMTYKAGQTEIGKRNAGVNEREATIKEYLSPAQKRLMIAQAGEADRSPVGGSGRQKTAAEMEIINGMQEAILQSKEPIIKENQGDILDAIRENTTLPFSQIQKMVKKSYPKMPESQQQIKAKGIFDSIANDFQTKQQERLKQAKIQKNVNVVAAIDKQLDDNPFEVDQLAESIKKEYDQAGAMITDAGAKAKAREQIIHQKLVLLGKQDPDLMPNDVQSNDPRNLRNLIVPQQTARTTPKGKQKPLGTAPPNWLLDYTGANQ